MAKKKLIGSAIKHPGRLTNEAKRDHLSVSAEAHKREHEGSGLGAAARFYLNVLKTAKHSKHR